MGGYVNLAFRDSGKTKSLVSYTGVYANFVNPLLYSDNPEDRKEAIKKIAKTYGKCSEQKDPHAGRLCPFSYGLTVVDFDTKKVVSMQSYKSIPTIGLNFPDTSINFVGELLIRGFLRPSIVDGMTGKEIASFPDGGFGNPKALWEWLDNELLSIQKESSARWERNGGKFTLDDHVFPVLEIRPLGWEFVEFDTTHDDCLRFLDLLMELKFPIDAETVSIWHEWAEEHDTKEKQ